MNTSSTFAVRALHLYKTYNGISGVAVPAVVDVNLDVRLGEVLLICGPNGSGKTTLLSMLECMVKPSSGCISIEEREVTTLTQHQLTAFRLGHIGFVFQAFQLLDSLTVRENIELVLNLTGVYRPVSHERAEWLLEELRISHRANFLPDALSGGEKQRVAIARSLANDPALLLADEPTGSLDSYAGQAAIDLLCNIAQRKNKTVIIVSHDERIQRYAHRVLRMEDGRFVEEMS